MQQNFNYYADLRDNKRAVQTSDHAKQINKDIERTFRDNELFKLDDGHVPRALRSLLCCYTLHDPEIGYCQGMAAVAALCLMVMGEEESFWILAALCAPEIYNKDGMNGGLEWEPEQAGKYRMRLLWHEKMPLIHLRFYQVERLVELGLPALHAHFQEQGIFSCSQYGVTKWFVGLFVPTKLPFDTVLRMFDIFLSEGYKSLFRFGLGLLKYMEGAMLKEDFEGVLAYVDEFPAHVDEDSYINTAMGLKITHRQLDHMETNFRGLQSTNASPRKGSNV